MVGSKILIFTPTPVNVVDGSNYKRTHETPQRGIAEFESRETFMMDATKKHKKDGRKIICHQDIVIGREKAKVFTHSYSFLTSINHLQIDNLTLCFISPVLI